MPTVERQVGRTQDGVVNSGALPKEGEAIIADTSGSIGNEHLLATVNGARTSGVARDDVDELGLPFTVQLTGSAQMATIASALSNDTELSVRSAGRVAAAVSGHWVHGIGRGTTAGADGDLVLVDMDRGGYFKP